MAITHAAKEAIWLRSLILQLFNLDLQATTLFSDNKLAIEQQKTTNIILVLNTSTSDSISYVTLSKMVPFILYTVLLMI